ncbi:MAG: nucleoside deaminase [Enterococcus sp.]|nr:nucleoside deaminase [Enterococcus sp.]
MLNEAIALAVENVRNGGGPFGAIIVTAEGKVYEGVNRVTANNDPTAHAEVTAIRNACAGENTFDLSGATLYTSCEPCPMCLGASLWARITKVVYGADRWDAADAGFDDAEFYRVIANPPIQRDEDGEYLAPFNEWKSLTDRVDY